MYKDIVIYYSSLAAPHCISSMCSRWDQTDWNLIIETWLNKSQLQLILNNTRPNAVGELYEVLGSKVHYDMSWEGCNTLKITPNTSSDSTLSDMRNSRMVYVKNISSTPIEGDSGLLNVKIDTIVSGSRIGGW